MKLGAIAFLLSAAMLGSAVAADAPPPVEKKTPAPIVFFDIAGPDVAKLKSFYSDVFAGARTPRAISTAQAFSARCGRIRPRR